METTSRRLSYQIGGGIKEEKKMKAIEVGGPQVMYLCVIYRYASRLQLLKSRFNVMGPRTLQRWMKRSGMVDMARLLFFTQSESCGK